jgi:hypothetical protein
VNGIFLPLRVNSLPLATIYEVKIPLRKWKKSLLQRNPAQMTWANVVLKKGRYLTVERKKLTGGVQYLAYLNASFQTSFCQLSKRRFSGAKLLFLLIFLSHN